MYNVKVVDEAWENTIMALTNLQKRIIWHIKQHNGNRDEAAIITALLKSDSQQKEFLAYLMNNPTMTPTQMIDKADSLRKTQE